MALTLLSAGFLGTVASGSFSQAHIASVVCHTFVVASERGISGTSPSAVSYGGVSILANPVTALTQITSASRAHRVYHLPKGSHPGAGSHTVAVTWGGGDHIGVGIVEVQADGTITFTTNSADNQGSTITVPITSVLGDLVISVAQANSATTFTPSNGQTEYGEGAWYLNTAHVIGVQTGVQTAASWGSAGSTCGSAFVIHEEVDAEDAEGAEQTQLAPTNQLEGAPLITIATTAQIALLNQLAGAPIVPGAAQALLAPTNQLAGAPIVVGYLEQRGGSIGSAEGSPVVAAALQALTSAQSQVSGSPVATGEVGQGAYLQNAAQTTPPGAEGALSTQLAPTNQLSGSPVFGGVLEQRSATQTQTAGVPIWRAALSAVLSFVSGLLGTPVTTGALEQRSGLRFFVRSGEPPRPTSWVRTSVQAPAIRATIRAPGVRWRS